MDLGKRARSETKGMTLGDEVGGGDGLGVFGTEIAIGPKLVLEQPGLETGRCN